MHVSKVHGITVHLHEGILGRGCRRKATHHTRTPEVNNTNYGKPHAARAHSTGLLSRADGSHQSDGTLPNTSKVCGGAAPRKDTTARERMISAARGRQEKWNVAVDLGPTTPATGPTRNGSQVTQEKSAGISPVDVTGPHTGQGWGTISTHHLFVCRNQNKETQGNRQHNTHSPGHHKPVPPPPTQHRSPLCTPPT